jgi:hypothetical protein
MTPAAMNTLEISGQLWMVIEPLLLPVRKLKVAGRSRFAQGSTTFIG